MAAAVASAPPKLRWGELDEDDTEDLAYLLPPPVVTGPDANDTKRIVTHKFDENDRNVKVTTTIRVRKIGRAHLSKKGLDRREWTKFGDAVKDEPGSRLTMVSTEEIFLERPRAPGSKQEEVLAAGDPLGSLGGKAGAVLMVCRSCGKKGDHWTSKCPYRDLATQNEGFTDKPPSTDTASAGGGKGGAYVPPSVRAGANRTPMTRRNENSVRVTNLAEDTREPDLHELFQTFGTVTRVYVAVDQKSGKSRGFGFINFASREDADKAIKKLNGYPYDNLILRVEWATPRPN